MDTLLYRDENVDTVSTKLTKKALLFENGKCGYIAILRDENVDTISNISKAWPEMWIEEFLAKCLKMIIYMHLIK